MVLVWLGYVVVVTGFGPLFFQRKHLLSVLLLLEVLNLGLFMVLVGVGQGLGFPSYFCLVFLTVGVCEAAVGLSLLVVVVRNWGNDLVSSFGVTKF